jgi:phosphatidylglycerol---prolipoprotein diacylglyceryl transferase
VFPVLAQLGPFTFYTYTVLIDLGLAVALAVLFLRAPAGRGPRWLDAGLAATLGGFIGARLLFISVNGDFYFPHIDEVLQVWRGGLAWPGAAAGALFGLWAYAQRQHEPLPPLLDALALPVALLGLLGWGGCLAAGCAYGVEVAPGQLPAVLTTTAPDLFGLSVPRFATQLVGLAWSALALLIICALLRGPARGWRPGLLGALALALVAAGLLALSFTRGEPTLYVAGLRIETVGSGLVLIAALLLGGLMLTRPAPLPSLLPETLPSGVAEAAPSDAPANP